MFHPELQAALNELKDAISKESFEQKGKFPPSLKPILTKVALKAIHCGEYDDNFFTLMPKLFIYNKFTMTVSSPTISVYRVAHIFCFARNSLSELSIPSTKSYCLHDKTSSWKNWRRLQKRDSRRHRKSTRRTYDIGNNGKRKRRRMAMEPA